MHRLWLALLLLSLPLNQWAAAAHFHGGEPQSCTLSDHQDAGVLHVHAGDCDQCQFLFGSAVAPPALSWQVHSTLAPHLTRLADPADPNPPRRRLEEPPR